MLCYVVLCYQSYDILVIVCFVIVCYVIGMLWYRMLWHGMLCYASRSCYDMLYYNAL